MSEFEDHNDVARGAVLRHSLYVGNPNNRDLPKRNALTVSAALREVMRIMEGNEHLGAIEDVLAENILGEIDKYVATFIPKGGDDDLWLAFDNVVDNLGIEVKALDERTFERLEAALNEFRQNDLRLFGK
jgi:hypothetical protein